MPQQSVLRLNISLRRAIAESLMEMFTLSGPYENHSTLEGFAGELLESCVAAYRCAKSSPRVKPNFMPTHYHPPR